MSIWYAIPSARPIEEVAPVLRAWIERGYKPLLWRDETEGHYPGYAQAVNELVKRILERDKNADWIVTGGDDTLPDPNRTAGQIAAECCAYFGTLHWPVDKLGDIRNKTFGIMQPTGDRFAGGSIDRIAGSPWLGREWCLRANQGKGPFWPEFTHMFGDQALKATAEKLGVYWMRPDLIHFHKHFMRESDALDANATRSQVPPHLKKWNTQEHWHEMLTIYRRLEAEGFASCMPLEAVSK